MFEGRFFPSPLAFEGNFRLEGDAIQNAFRDATLKGHESELLLAFKLTLLWGSLTPAERARAVADLYDLAARPLPQATALKLKGSQEPEGTAR